MNYSDTPGGPSAAVPASIARGPAPEGPPPPVLALFDERVRETPDAPAVEDGDLRWTYAETAALAARAAAALDGKVSRGDLVGVCLERSVALVALTIALARIGAVYLPLGPNPGDRRLQAATAEAGVRCLIGGPAMPRPDRSTAAPLVLPLPHEGANATGPISAVFPAGAATPMPEGALYAVLTSGSTGSPKAVVVGGASMAVLQQSYGRLTGSGPGDRHSMLIGPAFDPHLKETWAALTSGAALSIPPDKVRFDVGELTDWLRSARVTITTLPTPLAETVLDRPWRHLPDLRHLTIGGDRLRRRPSSDVTATVHNVYGPAECTVDATWYTLDPAHSGSDGPPPIGRPVPGAVVLVTDDSGLIVPRGTPGELRVGGTCLSYGYLDRELTAHRFVAPPHGVEGIERVYCTGDRVRMRQNGELEFLGRIDGQVKVSGVRVELAEVEAALERDPAVRRAVVAARSARDGFRQLVGFVVAEQGRQPDGARILAGARPWLPEQALPVRVHTVESFPLNANGKVDREALLVGAASASPGPATGTAATAAPDPASALEDTVLRLCRDAVGDQALTLSDNLSARGASSLAAARLLVALERQFGIRVRAYEILRQPDLRHLVSLVAARLAAPSPEEAAR
ncbi:AMP-binding protein [Streptomyces flaveolus]|uniref:AMP-binding protein n=1 Tax=Streptomyces flaveolus TaxID=67297 RepID=UPI0033F4F8ED